MHPLAAAIAVVTMALLMAAPAPVVLVYYAGAKGGEPSRNGRARKRRFWSISDIK